MKNKIIEILFLFLKILTYQLRRIKKMFNYISEKHFKKNWINWNASTIKKPYQTGFLKFDLQIIYFLYKNYGKNKEI